MAKKQRSAFEDKVMKAFAGMPVDKWVAFIEKNAKDQDERNKYNLCAKRSLNMVNMKAYIEAHDNTEEAKRAFYNANWGIKYLKEDKKFVKDADGNKIPEIDPDTGDVIKVQSLVYGVEYFINTYIPEIKIEKKAQKTVKAFDLIKDWA